MRKLERIKWFEIIATWFGLGHFPVMPGTIGSLGAFPIFYFSVMSSSSIGEAKNTMLFFVILLTFIGLFAISKYHRLTRIIDNPKIVIDEVIGQLVTLIIAYEGIGKFAASNFKLDDSQPSLKVLGIIFLVAFIPFRFCDITKPFYISLIDRYWQNSLGVIFDDILAGILAALPFLLL
jgi:phosphatidylglycerophosphatase A